MIRRSAAIASVTALALAAVGISWTRDEAVPVPVQGADGGLSGPASEVVSTLASRILAEADGAQVVLLGEDHRSPLPDRIGAAMLEPGRFDCVALELHEDLQPSIDQFAAGASWTRSVWPAVRRVFGTQPLALGLDRKLVRTARKQGAYLVAVDRFPREMMHTMRMQRAWGMPMSAELRSAMVDERDEAMADALRELVESGRCERVLYSVGWNHLPGLPDHLAAAGLRVHATTVVHSRLPPLPDPLSVRWEDGRIAVE